MRLLLFGLVSFLSFNMTIAQDVILKLDDTKIECQIVEIKEGYISYVTEESDKVQWIFKAEIKEVMRGDRKVSFIDSINDVNEYEDIIITKDGQALEVKIGLVSGDFVHYTKKDRAHIIENKIAWEEVREILKRPEFEQNYSESNEEGYYNKVIKESSEKIKIKDFSELKDAHRNHIKTSFSGFGNGSLIMGYERAISLRLRAEGLIMAHGIGISSDNIDKRGVGLELGLKYKLKAPVVNVEFFDNHYLHGSYVKTSLGFTSINEKVERSNAESKFENVNRDYFFLGAGLGCQWVFDNRFTIDVFLGLNYFNGRFETTIDNNGELITTEVKEFEDGDLYGDNNKAFSAGLHLGYLFSVKREKR